MMAGKITTIKLLKIMLQAPDLILAINSGTKTGLLVTIWRLQPCKNLMASASVIITFQ